MKKREEIQYYKGFKIGDKFIVTGQPSYWDSALNENCPFNRVKYPYHGTIKAISKYCDRSNIIAMTDGNYGWSLDSLIHCKKIQNLRVIRKKKLNKLKNINHGNERRIL